MYSLIRSSSIIIGVLCSVNVFFHIKGLSFIRILGEKKRILPYIAALIFACLNMYFMREAFSTVWMALIHVSLSLIACDVISLVIRLFGRDTKVRRVWKKLMGAGLAFALSALVIAYGLINMAVVRETRYTLVNRNVQGSIVIGLISDVHLGTAMDAEKFDRVLERTLEAGAEIIVLAGDIVDEGTTQAEFDTLCEYLSARRAPKGTYYVYGNHDASRYSGILTKDAIEQALTKAGVTVLTDESIFIDGWLRIAGRKDANDRKRLSAKELLKDADAESEFIVLIDHQPAQTASCAEAGADLLLSGHTHNGQIWPIGPLSKLLKINEIEYGHEEIGDMDAIVSSGAAGWACAFRTGGRSEYVIIDVSGK